MNRRRFLLGSLLVLPLSGRAEPPFGVVREVSGEVYLSDYHVHRNTALRPGQTLSTGADGEIWFSVGADAFFLRPNGRVRLETSRADATVLDFLRLAGGALGATFARGPMRRLFTPTSTIGIRGTGVYLEAAPQWTYACTCFGNTEIAPRNGAAPLMLIRSNDHVARRIDRDSSTLEMPFTRHTSEEIARLESLVGRPNPF